jgi:hypothetical protein
MVVALGKAQAWVEAAVSGEGTLAASVAAGASAEATAAAMFKLPGETAPISSAGFLEPTDMKGGV